MAPHPRFATAGIALPAGLVGSIAMLLSQKAEMKLTGREPSDTPARAIETLIDTDVDTDAAAARLSTVGHFTFGTVLGLGLLALDRIDGPLRAPLFTTWAWSVGTATLVTLGLAKPPTRWPAGQLATDIGHHVIYGIATASAYTAGRRWLDD